VYCTDCGRVRSDDERFCAHCGHRHPTVETPAAPSGDGTAGSTFEDLIAARVRAARRGESAGSSPEPPVPQPHPTKGLDLPEPSELSPFFFTRAMFLVGSLSVVLGLLFVPFAYVINEGAKFDWRLPTIASLLRDRDDENYVVGPALGYLAGGYLWTLLLVVILTVTALVLVRRPSTSADGAAERWASRLEGAIILGRTTSILLSLVAMWQISGMFTLQQAANTDGGLAGDDTVAYFSLGFGSVLSLLGLAALIFGGAALANRAALELKTQ